MTAYIRNVSENILGCSLTYLRIIKMGGEEPGCFQG
jgi:hypothetical protein